MSTPHIWNGHPTAMGQRGGLCARPTPVAIAHSGQFLAYPMESRYITSVVTDSSRASCQHSTQHVSPP